MSKSIFIYAVMALATTACQPSPQSTPVVSSEAESVTSSADESAETLSDNEISAGAIAFMQAVTSDDPNVLRAYYPDGYDIREFESDMPDPVFVHQTLRPIIMAEPMSAKQVAHEGHRFSVLFYQTRYKDRLDEKAYLEKQYLKSFFVCNFENSNRRWKVAHPILCYDETEGPYESEPDV